MKRLIFLAFLAFAFTGFGQQKMTVSGTVVDTNINVPVQNAVAMAIRVKDSTLLGFQRTDKYGSFKFTLPLDTIQLIVRHPQFNDFNSYLFGSTENNSFNLDPLPMPDKSTNLGEFVLYANRNPIYYRGDTLVYVADSFKVKENAVVEDLLKKLPGIQVDANGKITSQGTEIGQVLVDGDEFFGSDPTMATKNLAAKGVENVKVYEKESEDGSDEKIQVLDLTLKEEARKGYFGKVSGAGGSDFVKNDFYESELLLNRYNSKQKIAVFGLASNTPKSNFGWGDANRFGLDGGDRMDWDNPSDDLPEWEGGSMNTNSGVPRTIRAGFYLDQQLWKGGEVRLNYTYNDNKLLRETRSKSQYFLQDTSYTTDNESINDSRTKKNELGVKFKQKIDSLTRFEVETKLNLSFTETKSNTLTNYRSQRDSLVRFTTVDNPTDAENASMTNTFRFYRNFMKKNRKLMARYNLVLTDNATDGSLLSIDRDAVTDTINQYYNQKKENRTKAIAQTAYVNFVEPIGGLKNWKTEFEYEFYTNNNNQRKSTFNVAENGGAPTFDPNFSNQFETQRMQNRAGAFLIFENNKTRVSAGTRVRNIGIDNRNILTSSLIRQDMTNVLPRLIVQHKFTQTSRIRLQYNTTSTLPTVDQLQPVQDNSNPNFIRMGNADLEPDYSHSVNLNYNMWKGLSGFYVYSGANYTLDQNAFSTSTTYDPVFFRTTSQAINIDHADYFSFYGGSGFPIPKLKDFRGDINLNAYHNNTENLIDGQKNETRNTGLGAGLGFNYNGDSLNLSVRGDLDYVIPSNSLSSASNQPYTNYSFSFDADWTLPKQFFFRTNLSYTINGQRAAGYGKNYLIWNATVERSFLKTQNLFVGVEAYDLLNQNISVYRQVSTNVITDNITNVIARYFMLKVTLRFNNNHTKEEVNDNMW